MLVNGGIGINHCTTANWRNQQCRSKLEWHLATEVKPTNTNISIVYDKHLLCLHICYLVYNHISYRFLCCFHVLTFDDDTTVNLHIYKVTSNEDNIVLWNVIIVGCQVFAYLLLGRWVASCFWWQSAWPLVVDTWCTLLAPLYRPCLTRFFIFLNVMWLVFEVHRYMQIY